jgi:hypothetical protein
VSDHVGFWVDFIEDRLLQTHTAEALDPSCRDFTATHVKEKEAYEAELLSQLEHHNFSKQWKRLVRRSHRRGFSPALQRRYDSLNRVWKDAAIHAGKKCGKRRFGFPSSPKLRAAGNNVRYWKIRLSCARNRTALPAGIHLLQQRGKVTDNYGSNLTRQQAETELKAARKQLRTLQKDAATLRKTHLQELAEVYAFKHDITGEAALKAITPAEATRELYARIRFTIKDPASGATSRLLIPSPTDANYPDPAKCTIWDEVDDPARMFDLLLEKNRLQLRQTRRSPFTFGRLKQLVGRFGTNIYCDWVLDGTLDPSDWTDIPLLQAWIRNWAHTSISRLPPFRAHYSARRYREIYGKIKERKTSSPSGLHFGHVHAILDNDKLVHLRKSMDMYPFQFGFAPALWKEIVDVMIEKIHGSPYIHKLRLIAIVENQFSCALRQLWKYQIMPRAEDLGLIGHGQLGGRRGFQTYDCLLQQRLGFDIVRLTYVNAFMTDFDASGCYDRIIKGLGGIHARRSGATRETVRTSCLVKRDAKHRAKTAHGISPGYFCGGLDDEQEGEGQGIVNAGETWGLLSTTMFKTLNENSFGLDFRRADGELRTHKVIVGYIDDANGGTTSRHAHDPDELLLLKRDSQQASQNHELLLFWSGGALAPAKTRVWPMIHVWNNGVHRLMSTDDFDDAIGEYRIKSHETDTWHRIKLLGPDESGKNLGVLVTPSGTSIPEEDRRYQQSLELAGRIIPRTTSRYQADVLCRTIWTPAMTYPLSVTTHSPKSCHRIASPFLQAIIPKLGFPRTMKRVVIHGPRRYGGHEIAKLITEQGIGAVTMLLGHLRSQSDVGQLIQILLSYIQLHAGIDQPYLECCRRRLPHVPTTWLSHLRQFLATFHGSMHIHDYWLPPKPRDNDKYLMDDLLIVCRSDAEVKRFNVCRLHLRAIFLSDIADPTGIRIESRYLHSNCTPNHSTWFWPDVPCPPPSYWVTWRRWLKRLYSPHSKRSHRVHRSLPLQRNQRLRQWLRVPLHLHPTTWSFDDTTNQVYHTLDNNVTVFTDAYNGDHTYTRSTITVTQVPPNAVPVSVTDFFDNVRLIHYLDRPPLPTTMSATEFPTFKAYFDSLPLLVQQLIGAVTLNGFAHLSDGMETLASRIAAGDIMLVSDGAVRHQKGAFAWKLVPTDHSRRDYNLIGTGPCDADPATLNSFRTELAGILSGLLFVEALLAYYEFDPTSDASLLIYCDNISAIRRVRDPIPTRGPRHRLIPEYDLIAEIQRIRDTLDLPFDPTHVKGHQDDDKEYDQLSYPSQINVDCDTLAGDFLTNPPDDLPARTSAPFIPSSLAALYIDNCLVTTDYSNRIRLATNGAELRRYIIGKTHWTDYTFDSVDWDAHGSALAQQSRSAQVRLLKFMHGWLPTMKRQKRYRLSSSSRCPICKTRRESQSHILCCRHPHSRANFSLQLQLAKKFLSPYKPLPLLWKTITDWLLHTFCDRPAPSDVFPDDAIGHKLRTALYAQSNIGWSNALRGRLTPLWGEIQSDYYRQLYPDGKRPKSFTAPVFQVRLVNTMWHIFAGIWAQRNAILHEKTVGTSVERMNTQLQRLYKFRAHYVRDQDLDLFTTYSLSHALSLPPYTKHSWLHTLHIAVRCRHKSLDCLQHDPTTPLINTSHQHLHELHDTHTTLHIITAS